MEPGTIIDAQHPPAPPPAQNQPPPNHVKHSHRFLLVYLTVLLIATVAGSVYAWQHQQASSLKKKNQLLAAQNGQLNAKVELLTKPKPNATNNNSPLIYTEDWKTYCDIVHSTCFRYPKDWIISANSSSTVATAALNNTTNRVTSQYTAPITTQALDQVFYVADIKDPNKKDLGLKIVARVRGNAPDYVIVDSKYLETNHIAVGKTASFMDSARFTSKDTKTSIQFVAKPSGAVQSNIKSTDQATAWFSTDDAKTSLMMLQSFYYQ